MRSGGNLRVAEVGGRRWQVALTEPVVAAAHGAANAPEQDCVARSGGHLRAADGDERRRRVTLTDLVAAAAHGAVIAPDQAEWRAPAATCA